MARARWVQSWITSVAATGSCLLHTRLTKQELVEQFTVNEIESSDEWIVMRTGIRERHIASPSESTSDLGFNAARLVAGPWRPRIWTLIVCATSTPNMYLPSAVCIIEDKLSATNAAATDMNAACSGFIYVDLLLSLQGNINIVRESLSWFGIPESKTYVNLDRYGNTATAAIPIAFDEALTSDLTEPSSALLLVGSAVG